MNIRVILLCATVFVACKKDKKFQDETLTPVEVSIRVPAMDNYVRTVDKLTIPLNIVLSASAPKFFSLNIATNNDTILQLIDENKLQDAVLLDESYYQLPRGTDIRFGLDSQHVMLDVNMQAVEKYYGKKLALAVKLQNIGKQNTLSATAGTAIVLINTAQLLRPDELHYLSFTAAGQVWTLPSGDDHTLGDTEVTLPVSLTLGGVPGGAFTLQAQPAMDSAQTLVANGTITDGVLLQPETDFTWPVSIAFDAFTNTAKFNIKVKSAVIKANINKKPVLALKIVDPTRHLIDTIKHTLVMVLDPAKLIETDITDTKVRYTVQFENDNANENSPKLIDNNINTKFLIGSFREQWMKLEFANAITTGSYTITSANDAPDRDPKNWTIEGSNNDVDWTVVDTRTDQNFGSRFQTIKYSFSNTVAFKYYRLHISANRGSDLLQIAEWRLLKRP